MSLRITIGDVEYEWCGGFGSVLKSHERGIKVGDVRVITGILFYATYIYKRGMFDYEVNWIPVERIEIGWIRDFKHKLFCGEW